MALVSCGKCGQKASRVTHYQATTQLAIPRQFALL